ncbi:MAG: hypothetical protein AB1390_12470, partial [Nitrospirota bacterium]
MRELSVLLAPVFWSLKNDVMKFNWSFYRKTSFYIASSGIFIFLVTKLLNTGMIRLQNLSPEVFNFLLIKGYSLIFIIIFFMQIINGFVISLNTYYHSKEMEVLLISPVSRTSLFFSRLFETHLKASWMLVIFGIPLLIAAGLIYKTNLFFYFYAVVLFTGFSAIPVHIGAGITILLSGLFHARRLKKFLFSTGGFIILFLVILLRMLKPERFVNPELFANLTLFIAEMKTSSFILLPNRWLSESIFDFLSQTFDIATLIFIALLLLTSYVSMLFLMLIFKKFHYRGWNLLQEGEAILKKKRQVSQITPVSGGETTPRL